MPVDILIGVERVEIMSVDILIRICMSVVECC